MQVIPPQPKKTSFISLVSYHTNRRALQTRDEAATIISDTNLWETTNGQNISNNRKQCQILILWKVCNN